MANFCNKCGAPVSGIFCNKCGADTRLAAGPPPAPPSPQPSPVVAPPVPPSVSPASPKFCNKCGAPSTGAAFCNKCGADLRQSASPAASPAPSSPVGQTPLPAPPPQPISTPAVSTQAQTKGSPLAKILIGFVIVIVSIGALAAGGMYYVVYRVKQKVHQVVRDAGMSSSSDSNSSSGGNSILGAISKAVSNSGSGDSSDGGSGGTGSNGGIKGDVCRLLSKEEVGRAIGVEIVATETSDVGCSYLAKGDSADMTAKHVSAMMATKGADAKTQKMIEAFAGGIGKMSQSESHDSGMDKNGNVPVFGFSVDSNSAETQMRLNAKVLGSLGPGQQDISGIGDQAFDEAGAMLMARKGDKLIRIMYSTCPCTLENIKPLAKKIADGL